MLQVTLPTVDYYDLPLFAEAAPEPEQETRPAPQAKVKQPKQPKLPNTPALRQQYNFHNVGVMSLGNFLRSKTIIKKSIYTRYYSEHRVNLEYIELKTPKKSYTLWWIDETNGEEYGYSVSKAIWDLYDVPSRTIGGNH